MNNLSLKQLRAFIAVAELGRFRLAAEKLCVTQSAVSVLVKELENLLGAALFDRHTRMVGLTHAGRVFLPMARRVIDQIEIAVDTVEDLVSLRSGKVTIASPIVLAATLLPPVIAAYKDKHRDIRVTLHDLSEDRIRDLLLDGTADIGIGTTRQVEEKIREHRLFSDRLAVFFRKCHPFGRLDAVRWSDLADETLIGFSSNSPIQTIVDRGLEDNGIATDRAFSVNFSTTMLSLVNQGLGICIAPENSYRLSVPTDTEMRPLVEPEIRRDMVALTLREQAPSPAAREFLDMLLAIRKSSDR